MPYKPRWTEEDKAFLFAHLHKLTVLQIARELKKTERAVNLFLHRCRKNPASCVNKNVILIILETAFVRPEYFRPTRTFYEAVKIGQKRWWALYKGVIRATDEECRRVMEHLKIDREDLFGNRQLNLFE
jgi:hypothetical protein